MSTLQSYQANFLRSFSPHLHLPSRSDPIYLMFFMLILAVTLGLQVNSWNPRVRCDSNHLLSNPRLMTWIALSYRNKSTQGFFKDIRKIQSESLNSHYAKNMQIDPASSPCERFFMSNQSCCSKDTLNLLYTSFNKYYQIEFRAVNYPIVQYAYQLNHQLLSNSCSRRNFLDDRFEAVEGEYKVLMNEMINIERKFINETLCLICLSPKDMPNFIYPQKPYINTNIWIINKQYFINKTTQIANIFSKLEDLHQKTMNLIKESVSDVSSTSQCQALRLEALNDGFLNKLKICHNQRDCKRISVQYFGEPAAPQYMLYIKMRSLKQSLNQARAKIILSLTDGIGFAGNETQYRAIYGSHYYPRVESFENPDFQGLW